MKWYGRIAIVLLAASLCSSGCEESGTKSQKRYTEEDLFEINRNRVGQESVKIDKYVSHYGLTMEKSSTGLRYDIYAQYDGEKAKTGQMATVSYNAYLLDSTHVESTDVHGLHIFRIGEDPIISGIHEAVQLMHVGDSARIVVPSYLAYGLTGDGNNVPPNAPLFYDICLVDLR